MYLICLHFLNAAAPSIRWALVGMGWMGVLMPRPAQVVAIERDKAGDK
jgi:hypothetical protein